MFRSTDRGATWTHVEGEFADGTLVWRGGKLFAKGSTVPFSVMRSDDDGVTFDPHPAYDPQHTAATIRVLEFSVAPGGEVFAWLEFGTGINTVGVSTDHGDTWTHESMEEFPTAFDAANPNVFYGRTKRSRDHGLSFQPITQGLTDVNGTLVSHPVDNHVYYYGSGQLYESTNQGDLWTVIQSDLNSVAGKTPVVVAQDGSCTILRHLNSTNTAYYGPTCGGTLTALTSPGVGLSQLLTYSSTGTRTVLAAPYGNGLYRATLP